MRIHRCSVRSRLASLLAGIALAVSARAGAQEASAPADRSLEEEFLFESGGFVYAASRREEPAVRAPATVTVIQADEIRRHGWRSVADALRSVMGVYVADDQTYPFVAIRGWAPPGDYMTRVLVLLDGHDTNELVAASGTGTAMEIPIELVERIELVRGPSSVLYGTNAFFGVINIVTKRGRDVGATLVGEIGNKHTRGGLAAYGAGVGEGGDLLLAGSHRRTAGDATGFVDFGFPSVDDSERSGEGFAKYAEGDLLVLGRWSRRNSAWFTDKLLFGEVRWTPRTSDDLGWSFRLFGDDYRFDAAFDFTPTFPVFRDAWDAYVWGGEVMADWKWDDAHSLTLGVEHRRVRTLLANGDDGAPPNQRDRIPFNQTRAFAEDRFHADDRWTFVAGVQANWNSLFENAVSPRLAAIFQPQPQTVVKLLAGEGFRNPSVYEAFYEDGFFYFANPGIRPERVRTVELSLEHALDARHTLQAAVFRSGVQDQILLTTSPALGGVQYLNGNDTRIGGIEAGVRGRSESGGDAFANAALLSDFGRDVVNLPNLVAHAGGTVPIVPERLFLAGRGSYVSRRPDGSGSDGIDEFLTVDLGLNWRAPCDGLEVWLGVWNLFDAPVETGLGQDFIPDRVRTDRRFVGLKAAVRF